MPQTVQRRFGFGDSRQNVWYCEKDAEGKFGAIERRNIASTFQIRDFYTVVESDALSDKVEKEFYGSLDDYWGKFLSEIEGIFSSGRVAEVVGEPLAVLRDAVFHFIKRTPEFVSDFADDLSIGRELINIVVDAMRTEGVQSNEIDGYEAKYSAPHKVKALGRSIRVKSALASSDRVSAALEGFSVRWAVVSSKHSLVLSSLYVYRIGNGGSNGLDNPSFEIWVPISPKRVLILLRDEVGRIPLTSEIDREKVREINLYASRQAQALASHSKELLQSLTGLEISER
ncbi:DUF4238 domain-containing protein [Lentibacter algarum]|uniref:DUF4238 domain-containing protein n=1 Tax=Lentibacter algarum TaxID=576131 RepID=UPI001C083845|nr:DUF4238 domain-containing protein [Lentibacter algarum]